MSGKRALIVGVASDRSIAWGIAQAMHREGAELAFTYVNDKFKDRVQPLAESLGSKLVLPLDVTNDAEIESTFGALKQAWGSLDVLVHAVAYRAARGAGGRLRREHLARGLPRRARRLQLQPHCAGARRASR